MNYFIIGISYLCSSPAQCFKLDAGAFYHRCGLCWPHPHENFKPISSTLAQFVLRDEKSLPRQDSLYDQMKTVRELARKAGCYDAEDFIVEFLARVENKDKKSE